MNDGKGITSCAPGPMHWASSQESLTSLAIHVTPSQAPRQVRRVLKALTLMRLIGH